MSSSGLDRARRRIRPATVKLSGTISAGAVAVMNHFLSWRPRSASTAFSDSDHRQGATVCAGRGGPPDRSRCPWLIRRSLSSGSSLPGGAAARRPDDPVNRPFVIRITSPGCHHTCSEPYMTAPVERGHRPATFAHAKPDRLFGVICRPLFSRRDQAMSIGSATDQSGSGPARRSGGPEFDEARTHRRQPPGLQNTGRTPCGDMPDPDDAFPLSGPGRVCESARSPALHRAEPGTAARRREVPCGSALHSARRSPSRALITAFLSRKAVRRVRRLRPCPWGTGTSSRLRPTPMPPRLPCRSWPTLRWAWPSPRATVNRRPPPRQRRWRRWRRCHRRCRQDRCQQRGHGRLAMHPHA